MVLLGGLVVAATSGGPAAAETGGSTKLESRVRESSPPEYEGEGQDPLFNGGTHSSISGDGRILAFDQFLYDGSPYRASVYIRDRAAASGDPEYLTEIPGDFIEDFGFSAWSPTVSRDGCHVAFLTDYPFDEDLDTDNDGTDVYRYTRPECNDGSPAFTLVSVAQYELAGLSIEPAPGSSNDFGYSFVSGALETPQFFTVTATGIAGRDAAVTLEIIRTTNQDPPIFQLPPAVFTLGSGGTCAEGMILRTGESCTVEVEAFTLWDPAKAEVVEQRVTADLEVIGNANQSATAPLVVNDGSVTVEPPSHDFGSVVAGSTSSPQDFTVTATGAVNLTQASLTNSAGGVFEVVSDDCSPIPNLLIDESCTVTITATPPGENSTYNGNLRVAYATEIIDVPLTVSSPIGMRLRPLRTLAEASRPVLQQVLPPLPRALGSVDTGALPTFAQCDPDYFYGFDERYDRDCTPAISADGSVVAYTAYSPVVTGEPGTAVRTVYIVAPDLDPETDPNHTTALPPPSAPAPWIYAYGSIDPSISDDGRYVAYTSDRSFPDGDGWQDFSENGPQVWRYDRSAGVSVPVSVTGDPDIAPNGPSYQPSISADGSKVAFTSSAFDLLGNEGSLGTEFAECGQYEGEYACSEVYVADVADTSTAITLVSDPVPGDLEERESFGPAISGDGEFVVFTTERTNLFGDPPPPPPPPTGATTTAPITDYEVSDILIARASAAGAPVVGRITVTEPGDTDPAPCCSGDAAVDATARHVSFTSDAGNDLLGVSPPATSLEQYHVYVRERPPDLRIAPNPAAFGLVPIGSSTVLTLTATNDGLSSFEPASITLPAGPFAITGGTCGTSPPFPVIPAGATCTVDVTFTPTTTTPADALLTIAEDPARFAAASDGTARLTGTGFTSGLAIAPPSADYGIVDVGTPSAPATFTVTNTGSIGNTLASITLGGANAGDFAVSGGTCTTTTPIPGNNGTCTIDVVFTPGASDARSATLTVNGERSTTATATLQGTGARYGLTITPTPRDFGLLRVGTPSAAVTFTVTSTGNAPNPLGALALGGANAGDWALSSDGCSNQTLPAGGSCTVNATFTPGATGGRAATLTASGKANSSATASLTGTGGVPTLTISPSPVAFGNVTVGQTSAPRALTIRNAGTITATIASISLGGTNPGRFNLSETCPGTLAPGATCSASASFAPDVVGAASATVVATEAGGQAATASLTGTGLAVPVPAISLEPGSVDFGQVIVRTTSPALTVTVRNSGDVPAPISGLVLGGAGALDYLITATTCTNATLPVNGTCQVTLTFTPSTFGSRPAVLVVSSSNGASATLTISGFGIYQPTLVVNPGVARPGNVVQAQGTGFPANRDLVLRFADSLGSLEVTTDATGAFELPVLVMGNMMMGTQTLQVDDQVPEFADVSAPLLVVLPTFQPPTFVVALRNDVLVVRG